MMRDFDRAMLSDRMALALAVWADLDARLQLLEVAIFGEARETFDLTPKPSARVVWSPLTREWAHERFEELRRAEARGEARARARALAESRQLAVEERANVLGESQPLERARDALTP
jgi:hypothetical protein